jgi:hypothetical protein
MSYISCRDNVLCFLVCYELCHAFHVGTMYYVSLCATNYVTYELWLWFFPMACMYLYPEYLTLDLSMVIYDVQWMYEWESPKFYSMLISK